MQGMRTIGFALNYDKASLLKYRVRQRFAMLTQRLQSSSGSCQIG
jgi:hypothetical protein